MPLTDEQLLKWLGGFYSKAFVATMAKELAESRQLVAQGLAADGEDYVQRIHERFGAKRQSGARKMRGRAAGAADLLRSARDLRVGI